MKSKRKRRRLKARSHPQRVKRSLRSTRLNTALSLKSFWLRWFSRDSEKKTAMQV